MRKADLINRISENTGIAKVDVLVTLENLFKEVKKSLLLCNGALKKALKKSKNVTEF